MPSLFDPIRLGAIAAPNRVLMAPLTRGRATAEFVPTPIMADYYVQRASAGLIITEATGISREGLGWPYAPGIWTDAHVAGWRTVVDAVHAAGGRMMLQLWHMGRIVHSSFLDGQPPVSSATVAAPGEAFTYAGKQPHSTPRALGESEVPRLLEDYRHATRNALAAGFDGVQIHAANGYLIDQFLRDDPNDRTDGYGGSIENRTRLLFEVTEAVVGVAGAERTAVRLSPNEPVQGVDDSDPRALFTHAAEGLSRFGLAFLELREPPVDGSRGQPKIPPVAPDIRGVFKGPLVLNSDYDRDRAQAAIDDGVADAITFGRRFLANPDLPRRLADGIPLNQPNEPTFYTRGPEGYVDYPAAA